MADSTFVIAVAGHSGAGKSTLISDLAIRLGGAVILRIDDYDSDTYPHAIQWIADGADPNEFQTPQFFADVRALKEGRAIIHPETKQEVLPAPFLILEEPFGRGRDVLREQIDFLVHLDTPLEVAYIRKLSRKSDFLPWEDNPSVFIEHLRENMEWYQRIGRNFYLAVSQSAKKDCDLIVDGLQSTESMSAEIYQAVMRKAER